MTRTVLAEAGDPAADSVVDSPGRASLQHEVIHMSATDRELVSRLGKFLVVGGTGLVVSNAALYALYQVIRVPLVPASALAALLAIGNNFVLNDRWTFNQLEHAARPHQWVLSYASVRATIRELRGINNWEKTAHVGAHRLEPQSVGGAAAAKA